MEIMLLEQVLGQGQELLLDLIPSRLAVVQEAQRQAMTVIKLQEQELEQEVAALREITLLQVQLDQDLGLLL
jgi:hypothetical protein